MTHLHPVIAPADRRRTFPTLGFFMGAALGIALLSAQPALAQLAVPPAVRVGNPADVGMSAARLDLLTTAFTKEIADKALPGVTIMVARKGQVVYANAIGVRDATQPDAMAVNSLFRIYSMTKPITSVAAMMLVEEGKLQLSDTVAKHLPAFKDMRVLTVTGTEPARAMTVQDLLRHTSGLGYGEISPNVALKDGLAQAALYKPGVIDFDSREMTAAEQVSRLAKIPLLHQPGTAWEYSLSTDLLGRVIEAASGKRLGDFMAERIFVPLGMVDTAFYVPAPKASDRKSVV